MLTVAPKAPDRRLKSGVFQALAHTAIRIVPAPSEGYAPDSEVVVHLYD